jgi:hypothetical protein
VSSAQAELESAEANHDLACHRWSRTENLLAGRHVSSSEVEEAASLCSRPGRPASIPDRVRYNLFDRRTRRNTHRDRIDRNHRVLRRAAGDLFYRGHDRGSERIGSSRSFLRVLSRMEGVAPRSENRAGKRVGDRKWPKLSGREVKRTKKGRRNCFRRPRHVLSTSDFRTPRLPRTWAVRAGAGTARRIHRP